MLLSKQYCKGKKIKNKNQREKLMHWSACWGFGFDHHTILAPRVLH